MKCIILNLVFFTVLFTCFSSFGQLEKGTFVLREHFSFSFSDTDTEESSNQTVIIYTSNRKNYDFNTSFGYLVKDNQEVGFSFGIGKEKYQISNTDADEMSEGINKRYGISLYYRRYISIVDKIRFFASPSVAYRHDTGDYSKENYFSTATYSKSNYVGAYIYTGFLYNPCPKVGLNINFVGAGIQYSSSKEEGNNGYSSTNQALSSNFYSYFGLGGLNLGIQFML